VPAVIAKRAWLIIIEIAVAVKTGKVICAKSSGLGPELICALRVQMHVDDWLGSGL
jgi:hypothetical protein